MASAPRISIVTVNKDDAAGLYRTLRSVERLTDGETELIVVDGGSGDGSLEIARDFAHAVDTLVSEPDEGLYDAMNKGVAAARGAWVIFMNAGDAFAAPDALENLPLDDADIVHGRARAFGAGHLRDYADALWKGMAFCHQATLTRRAWLERFPFDPARRIVADWEFFVKCDRAGARFLAVDRVIADVDETGRSYRDPAERAAARLPIALRHYGWKTPTLVPFYLAQMAPARRSGA